MADRTPREYAAAQIKISETNLGSLNISSPENVLAAAQVQATTAVAAALLDIAEAVRQCSTPGQSIRYGLTDLTAAVGLLAEKTGG